MNPCDRPSSVLCPQLGFLRVTGFAPAPSSSEPAGFVESESCLKQRSAGPPFEPSWLRALMMSLSRLVIIPDRRIVRV